MTGERRIASSEGARRRARKRAAAAARPDGEEISETARVDDGESDGRAAREERDRVETDEGKAVAADQPGADDEVVDPEEIRRARARLLGGAGVVLAIALVYGGVEYGPPVVVLIITAVALISVIAAFWSSVRTLLGESKLSSADAFALGAPRAEEEQKRAVLRALKDLEFERAVGKISDEDYGVLAARYREDAKRLLRAIDQASQDQRERAELVVERRLRKLGLIAPEASAVEASPPDEPKEPVREEPAAESDEAPDEERPRASTERAKTAERSDDV